MKKIILASGSPRRKALLEQIGIKPIIKSADTDETLNTLAGNPKEWTEILAQRKADAVKRILKNMDAVIIAADTMVVCDGEIMNKPTSREDARRKISLLNGREHDVITGYYLEDLRTGNVIKNSVVTKVFFRHLTEKEIDDYVATGEGDDKAGAYGIQGLGALLVKKIEGCFFNVVGLPISSVYEDLVRLKVL